MERIVIIGAGGFGREVLQLIDRNLYKPVGFIDPDTNQFSHLSLPVLGDDSLIPDLHKKDIASCVCVALGNMKKRDKIFDIVIKHNLKLPPIIHSSAVVLAQKFVREGVIIYPNVVVMDNCQIGRGVLLNSGVTLGHDVTIGDFSNINPGVNMGGYINVGRQVLVGIGSCIREKVNVGDEAIIGAGSVVLKDVAPKTTVYGVPAKERGAD